MAVNFKSDTGYGYSLLPLFGVDPSLVSKAQSMGVVVDQLSPGTFIIRLGDVSYGSVTIKGSAITLAKQNGLGPASKDSLKFQFENILKKAVSSGQDTLGNLASMAAPSTPAEAFKTLGEVMSKINTDVSQTMAASEPPAQAKGKAAVASESLKAIQLIMGDSPVPLSAAISLYQPVTATSVGSKYYVIALWNGLKLAARLKSTKASFRAEGKLAKFQDALNDLGFSIKGDYASVHFDVTDIGLVQKTVGAIVGRIGISSVEQVGDPLIIVGK